MTRAGWIVLIPAVLIALYVTATFGLLGILGYVAVFAIAAVISLYLATHHHDPDHHTQKPHQPRRYDR